MFFVLLLLGTAFLATAAFARGPRVAVTSAFALAPALPCWIYFEMGAMRIDIRTMLAGVGIGCVLLHAQSRFHLQLITADFALVGIVIVQIVSEFLTSDATLSVAFDIALQWIVPYWFGRLAVNSMDDVRRLLPGIVYACFALSLWSAFESIFRVNPLGALVGHIGSAQAMSDLRWGLRRAEGPHTHPIFFGLHLVMMLPFALQAARAARCGTGPAWWRWTPWSIAAGAFFTMSRGPQMGIIITLLVLVVLLLPRWRPVILFPATLLVVMALGSGSMVIHLLEQWSGEATHMTIMMNGESVPYTGTNHRLLQVQVYAEALAESGWFGYGSTPLHAGETKIPFVEEQLRGIFSSIDNHYLQFGLQTGYLGLGLFVLLCLLGITYASYVFLYGTDEVRWLGTGLTGALLALTLLMSSVWLAGDYRFVLLAVLGYTGSLRLAVRREPRTCAAAAPISFTSLRLSPGYRVVASA